MPIPLPADNAPAYTYTQPIRDSIARVNEHESRSFVRVMGRQLFLNTRPWRMHGASVYGSTTTTAQRVAMADAAGMNMVRVVNFMLEDGNPATDPFTEFAWTKVDAYIAECAKRGLKVLIDLSTYRNMLKAATTNPYTVNWGPLITFATSRVNSITGVVYKDDPTIFMWSLAGEVDPPNAGDNTLGVTQAQVTNFFTNTLAQGQAADTNHLWCSGGFLHMDWNSGIDWAGIFAMADNDVIAIHDYSVADHNFSMPSAAAASVTNNKPWICEEFGTEQSVGDAVRAAEFSELYATNVSYESAGVAFWNLGTELAAPSHDVFTGTPLTWKAVTDAATRFGYYGAIGGSSDTTIAQNIQTGTTYTFNLADMGRLVRAGNAGAQTYTIPPTSTQNFPIGAQLKVMRYGAGTLTIAGGTGVTVQTPRSLTARIRYSTIEATHIAANEWVLDGDLT